MKKQLFGCLSLATLLLVQGCFWEEEVDNDKDLPIENVKENENTESNEKDQDLCPVAEIIKKGNVEECERSDLSEKDSTYCKEMISAEQLAEKRDEESCKKLEDERYKNYCLEKVIYLKNKDKSLIIIDEFNKGNYEEALKQQDEYLKNNPEDVGAKILKAEFLIEKGAATYEEESNAQSALQILDDVLLEYPENPKALFAKGYAYEIQNDFEEALASYKKALENKPQNARILNQIGHIYDLKGEREMAHKYYKNALEVGKENPSVLINLARASVKNNKAADAEKLLEEALASEVGMNSRQKAETYSLQAGLISRSNTKESLDKAYYLYNKAIEEDPRFPMAWAGRGWTTYSLIFKSKEVSITEQNDKINKAFKDIDQALVLNPEQTIAYAYKAHMYHIMKMFPKARKNYEKALEVVDFDITLMADEKLALRRYIQRDFLKFKKEEQEPISFKPSSLLQKISEWIVPIAVATCDESYMESDLVIYCDDINDLYGAEASHLETDGIGGTWLNSYTWLCDNSVYVIYCDEDCPEPIVPCNASCDCASSICEWDTCDDGCDGSCQGEKEETGSSSCEAIESVECGDPYSKVDERKNWGGEWNEFDEIINSDWVNQGSDWCLTVAGRHSTSEENADCWTLECHKVLKCTGTQCARGGDGTLCTVNDASNPTEYVWVNEERANWCVDDSYGENPDPNVACNSKCPSETTVLALFDAINPNITAVDQDGREIEENTESTASEELLLVATAGELIAATETDDTASDEDEEYWYNKAVEITPVCEDPEPEEISKFLLCDKSGQECAADPSYSTADDCFKARSITEVQTCKEIQEYKSDCANDTDISTEVLNHNESGIVSQEDRAGNIGTFESEHLFIDYNAPDIEKLKVTVETVGFSGGDETIQLLPTLDDDKKIVAHSEYKILIDMEDSSCLEKNCEEGGVSSGISGIDWNNSKIVIKDAEDISDTISYSFDTEGSDDFTFNMLTGEFETDTTNFTEKVELGFTGQVFRKAGNKTMYLLFQDLAGNTSQQTINFDVTPGIAANIKLDSANCGQVIANNEDECEIKVAIWDTFENPITDRKVRLSDVLKQEINGSYDLKEDAQQAFTNGVRMSDINTMSAADTDGYVGILPIRSLVPTIYFKTKTIGDDEVWYADVSRGAELDGVDARLVDLVLEVENVNGASQTTDEFTEFSEGTDVDLTFLPWVHMKLTNNSNCSNSSDPVEISLGDEALDVNLCAYVGLNGGIEGEELPSIFKSYVLGHSPAETDFKNEVIDEDLIGKPGQTLSFSNADYKNFATYLQAAEEGSLGDLSDIAITSDVELQVSEKDDLSGTRTIEYPGGNIGVLGEFTAYLIGADIEGGILGERYAYEEETEIVNIGGVSGDDVREELVANTYTMLRTKTAIADDGNLQSGIAFGNNEVKYYKGDVQLAGEISGVGTIVIEDGNLTIANDMNYATDKSSLGVVLINSNVQANPDTGNIYIDPSVKKVVGTFYADGSLFSGTPSNKIDYAEGGNYKKELRKQLLLEGTIFTKNSLGGSLGDVNNTDFFTPWGQTTSMEKARGFDLHYIRRYTKGLVNPEDSCQEGETNDDVSCNGWCVPSSTDESKCDRNPHAFVIRPDGRVKTSPPPGFSDMGSIDR